ncbi:MAG: thermonuclease family protein [Nitrospirae bacterium]|nr:thermonuclease family protein [Nitrospirota bacterium]MBF0590467.1 thermonuclease family protein [Nitrospirota bacterium]
MNNPQPKKAKERRISGRKKNRAVVVFLVLLLLLSLSFRRFGLRGRFYPKRQQQHQQQQQYHRERVVRVKDGDTVVLSAGPGRQSYTCRLYGIDSPETAKPNAPGQPYGVEATRQLEQLILGKDVEVTLTGEKTYNREVCILRLNNADINLRMIALGYAWAYKHYLKPPYMDDYINAQRQARAARAGLWQDANPEPPWDFRARLRHKNRS